MTSLDNDVFVNESHSAKEWWENDYSIRAQYVVPNWMHMMVLGFLIAIFISGVLCNVR